MLNPTLAHRLTTQYNGHATGSHGAMPLAQDSANGAYAQPSAALAEAMRRSRAGSCSGIEVPDPGKPIIAAAILQEAANTGGGMVWHPRRGGVWLLGASPGAANRAALLLRGMGWQAEMLEFPACISQLEAAVAGEATGMPACTPEISDMAGIEARVDVLPPQIGHILTPLWRVVAGTPQLLAQRWRPQAAALLPPALTTERDWAGHAASLLAARLLERAWVGNWPAQRKPNLPLMMDMPWMAPPDILPPPPDTRPGHAIVLPLAAAPEAEAWAALAARCGWSLTWDGIGTAVSHLATPARLPGTYYFAEFTTSVSETRWPALGQLVLSEKIDKTALAFAIGHGVAVCSDMAP